MESCFFIKWQQAFLHKTKLHKVFSNFMGRDRPGDASDEDLEEAPGGEPDRHLRNEASSTPSAPAKMAAGRAVAAREGGEDAFRRLFRLYRQRHRSDLSAVIDFAKPRSQKVPPPPPPWERLIGKAPLTRPQDPALAMPSGESSSLGVSPLTGMGLLLNRHAQDRALRLLSLRVISSPLSYSSVSDQDALRAGLRPVSQWKAYGLDSYPGFIFIPNPFLPGCQRHWVKQCLKQYTQKPNICNLDMHMSSKETIDLWGQSQQQLRNKNSNKREAKTLLEKLRWVTLGYHYNWNTKKYSADHYTSFPSDLAFLSEQVAKACGFPGFQAEAGILNYYHFDSSLGIHVDESELDHSQPLLSFSFGQSSIFLLGGQNREEAPVAMFMHSGDIMIMSGFSRLLYHAVPRVLPNLEGKPLPSCLELPCPADLPTDAVIEPCTQEDWEVCAKYLQASRINMTVRQVLAEGQSFPSEIRTDQEQDDVSIGSYHEENHETKKHKSNTDS